MKKVGQALTAAGIVCGLAGFAFAMSLSAPAVEIVFFKSFLSDALGKSGHEVRWENARRGEGESRIKIDISSQPPPRQETIQTVHMGEYGNELVVFFEESRRVDNVGRIIISGRYTVLPWPDLDVLALVFPSSDVQQVGERIRHLQRSALMYTLALSVLLLLAGEMVKRIERTRRTSTKGKKKVFTVAPQQATAVPLPRIECPPVPASLETLVSVGVADDGHGNHETFEDEWPMLFSRVKQEMESAEAEVRERLGKEYASLLAEPERNAKRRTEKAWHLLLSIQGIRNAVSVETPEIGETMPVPIAQQHELPLFGIAQISRALLPLDTHVPPDLDPNTVRKVILAFLRPGNRVPVLGGGYTSHEDLSKHLRDIPPRELGEILRWLSRIGVLLVRAHKKPGRELLSLRTSEDGLRSPGKEIVSAIMSAANIKTRMG